MSIGVRTFVSYQMLGSEFWSSDGAVGVLNCLVISPAPSVNCFCVNYLAVDESVVLKSPTTIVFGPLCPFISNSVY